MTVPTQNPFRPTRWEHHLVGNALIWFTQAAQRLCDSKSFYVYGSRGSGKTSLLRSICWEDLAFNESLRVQRTLSDFDHLGIYIRFPDHVSASMDFSRWHEGDGGESVQLEYHRFFSLAVELACVEKALDACHTLRVDGQLAYSPSQELDIVESIIAEFPALAILAGAAPKTFIDLARVCRQVIRRMNEACSRGTVAELLDQLPIRDAGQLLSYASEKLVSSVRMKATTEDKQVVFKFCLDDCEVLSSIQKRSLNTLVRLSKSPVFWIVSSVDSVRLDSQTFIPSQALTDADRVVISLNDREDGAFRELCQAVVSLRLLFAIPDRRREPLLSQDATSFFDLGQRLGSENVNSIIAQMIRRSTTPEAKKIVAAAEHLAGLLSGASLEPTAHSEPGRTLPYYEAYILMHWQGREDAFVVDFEEAKLERIDQHVGRMSEQRFSAWLRRKQTAALYHIAARLKVRNVPLAGANMIVALSDRSIRDFLEIMGEVFQEYLRKNKVPADDPRGLERFATSRTKISADIQARAIQTASRRYVDGVGHSEEVDLDAIARLIRGLGAFVSILQTDVSDPRTLRTAERGIFHLNLSDSKLSQQELSATKAAIRQAELAGYIRPEQIPVRLQKNFNVREKDTLTFRLHRRFAPYFNFSYRGPYEVVRLNPGSLVSLIFSQDDITPHRWANELAFGWDREAEQFDLPLGRLQSGR